MNSIGKSRQGAADITPKKENPELYKKHSPVELISVLPRTSGEKNDPPETSLNQRNISAVTDTGILPTSKDPIPPKVEKYTPKEQLLRIKSVVNIFFETNESESCMESKKYIQKQMSSSDKLFIQAKKKELITLELEIEQPSITPESLKKLDTIQKEISEFEPFFDKIKRIAEQLKCQTREELEIPPIMELSKALDTQDVKTLTELSFKVDEKTPQDMISLINSKLLKKTLIEHINNGREGLFRKPGAKSKIDNLKDHINKNELIANGQDDSLFNDADLLASHTKSMLRDTYQIKGTSVESYTKVFNKQDSLTNKLIFIDYVDVIYEFCQHEKISANRKNKLDMNGIAITLGLSLWGEGNITTTNGMENLAKAAGAEKINDFFNNWPIAKKEMLLK